MTPDQNDLWTRLQQFPFDPPDARVTMADKIAREQGWTITFTERAIDEYRRFLLLARTAGHGVSPSEVVDIVWHWHLLYTRSYWDELCGKVLQMPLHHEPSTGRRTETTRFENWYDRTLTSYRETFGHAPPADIWPRPDDRDDAAPFARKVDTRKYWLLPRRRSLAFAATAVVLMTLAMFAGGCTPAAAVENPLDLRGPAFLRLFGFIMVIGFIAAFSLRRMSRGPAEPATGTDLTPYEVAYLNGGPVLAVNTALANLMAAGLVTLDGHRLTLTAPSDVKAVDPFEADVLNAVDRGAGTRQGVVTYARRGLMRLEGRLQDLRLLDNGTGNTARTASLLLAWAIPILGALKILVGISRGRPVGILAMLLLVSVVIAIVLTRRLSRRTRAGDQMLRFLRHRHASQPTPPPAGFAVDPMPGMGGMGMALFGMAALSTAHPLMYAYDTEPMMAARRRPDGSSGSGCTASSGDTSSDSSSDSTWSSSDGGSSDSGGGSDGGSSCGSSCSPSCGGCGGGGD